MKKLLFVLVCCFAAFSVDAFSQVVIKSKTQTYRRPKPLSEYKKSFTVQHPTVSAKTSALSRKIQKAISYGFDIKEEMSQAQWLEEATFAVSYNANKILSVELTISGTGAYPSQHTNYVVVDTTTGKKLKAKDLFTNSDGLVTLLRKMQQAEIAQAKKEIAADKENAGENLDDLFRDSKFEPVHLDTFSVNKDGVTFFYDYGFPHVIQALQPSGVFSLSWKQLKPYIKPTGLLAQIKR